MSEPTNPSIPERADRPSWLELATTRAVLVRGVFVGVILCAINHGDCLMKGNFGWPCLFKSLLTATIPFMVSVVSSVQALRRDAV